jgi:hypothetical protein
MTISNHALTGALISMVVPNPFAAVLAAFISHFVMDMLPHYGRSEEPLVKYKIKSHWLILKTDAILCLILLILVPLFLKNKVDPVLCFSAMFAAILPDLVWTSRYLVYKFGKNKTLPKLSKFSKFHLKIQWSESKKGLYVDLAWFIIALAIIFKSLKCLLVAWLIILLVLHGLPGWIYVAGALAVLPDIVWLNSYFRYEKKALIPRRSAATKWHFDIQNYEYPWGIAVEIVLFLLTLWTILNLK